MKMIARGIFGKAGKNNGHRGGLKEGSANLRTSSQKEDEAGRDEFYDLENVSKTRKLNPATKIGAGDVFCDSENFDGFDF